ncbi:hypothetical protein BDQ17DRAFT_1259033 [Cyathus striatus]|nr:hypothetical protein BDQ17DRAFT_1259033 [Cyathus striatus]
MTGHVHGPEVGRHNDNYLLAQSGLLPWAAQYAVRPMINENTPPEDRFLQVFGDPAYGNSHQIISPYAGLTPRMEQEKEWNLVMASLRIEVEHGFGNTLRLFPFLNAWWKHQIYSSPLGIYYHVGILLTNAQNCLHPNQTSQYFNCEPPVLEEYFCN